MRIHTCGQGEQGAPLHPCARALHALREAGYDPELVKEPGYRMLPWTRWGGKRDRIKELSGQPNLPIVELDDGTVISGSGTIVRWAKEHPAAS